MTLPPTAVALTGFIAWAHALLVPVQSLRPWLVANGAVPANGFMPDNAGLSPFLQRLARAHANCVEGLPIFGGLMLAAFAVQLVIGTLWAVRLLVGA